MRLAKENKTKPETKSVAAFLAEVEPAILREVMEQLDGNRLAAGK